MSESRLKARLLRDISRFRDRVIATDGPTTPREKQAQTRAGNVLRQALRNYIAVCRGLPIIESGQVVLPKALPDVLALAGKELAAAGHTTQPPRRGICR